MLLSVRGGAMRAEVASEGNGLQAHVGRDGFAAFIAEAEPRRRRAVVAHRVCARDC